MLIPYNTDAPLYYFPYATIGTIVLNVLLFIPVFCTNDPYASAQDRQLDKPHQQKLEQLRRMLRGEQDTTAEDNPADGSEREDVQLPIGDSDRKRLLELHLVSA